MSHWLRVRNLPAWPKRVALGCALLALPMITLTLYRQPQALPPPVSSQPAPLPLVASPPPHSDVDPRNYCTRLYHAVCSKRGVTRDPTGAVRPDVDGELLALRTYEEIIRGHPDWSSEQVDQELVRTIFTPRRRGRVQSAYQWVRKTLERFIDRQPPHVFSASEKKQLKQRIRGTELQLPPPVSMYADEPDLLTKNDVLYERTIEGKTRIRVGGAYLLNAKSWFNLVFTMGHEFAHAIDPCELRSAGLSLAAYDRLSSCFARNGVIALPPDRRECGENDQLSETFADWLAANVVAEALGSFATEFHGGQLLGAVTNSVRDLCEQEDSIDELDKQLHPPPEVRIERIFGDNPKVRDLLGCAAPDRHPAAAGRDYCTFDEERKQP